jgi:hypothetical protein
MVSVWWLVAVFLVGAYAGILVFALMSMAVRAHKQVTNEEEAVETDGLRPVEQEEEWTHLRSPVEGAGAMRAD